MVTKSSEQIIDSRFLQTCDIPAEELIVEPFTMVIFGGAGDLSKRKLLPSVFHLYGEGEFSKSFSVIGFDRVEMTEEQYRNLMGESTEIIRNRDSDYLLRSSWSSPWQSDQSPAEQFFHPAYKAIAPAWSACLCTLPYIIIQRWLVLLPEICRPVFYLSNNITILGQYRIRLFLYMTPSA
jgi:hypothetical protein